MKKLWIIVLCIPLVSCGTSMQGNPAAIQIGASVGGAVGSIIGGNMDDYSGWAIGNMVGTIAGAAVGNAITTPKDTRQYSGVEDRNDSYSESVDSRNTGNYDRGEYNNARTLPLLIQNIRFIDENRDHIIEPKECCKLIFNLYNESNETLYNVYPRITLSNKNVGVSTPFIIEKIDAGQRIRYTASLYGYSNLKDGEVNVIITACQQDGGIGDVHQFSLETRR